MLLSIGVYLSTLAGLICSLRGREREAAICRTVVLPLCRLQLGHFVVFSCIHGMLTGQPYGMPLPSEINS